MKRLLAGLLLAAAVAVPFSAEAKCYSFDKVKGLNVCVKGDSFSDRDKAKAICKSAKGTDCGNVSSYSSSCNGECYDESGKKNQSLSGYD